MKILSIETSCDETAVSIVEVTNESVPHFKVLANLVRSQIDIHKEYGGVFPAMAKREHSKNLPVMVEQALKDANLHAPAKTSLISNFLKKVRMFGKKLSTILRREPDAAD